jgi:tyrosyl-tRNA synthetase
LDIHSKIGIIAKPPTEEIVTREDLQILFESNNHPTHYIGLEISGLLHLGSLIITGYKINDFLKAGVKCKIFLADWHSYINNKFDGNWDLIKEASTYYQEAFNFFCPGVEIITGSSLYSSSKDYWENMVRFSKNLTLSRNSRCLTIMGRSEKDKLHFAQYLYPPMQAVDIKALDLDIVHSGMDQRKVHMLVREVFPKLRWKVPIAVHHHLLPGLSESTRMGIDEDSNYDSTISSKMSKSKPWTCIFIHDNLEQIRSKLRRAWCPEKNVDNNPILEIVEYIILRESKELVIERPSKYGGVISFNNYQEVEKEYSSGKLHPADLKNSVAESIDKIIDPIRKYFESKSELFRIYDYK